MGHTMRDGALDPSPPQPAEKLVGVAGSRAAPGLPFSSVLGVLSGLLILGTAQTTLRDIDLYWHLVAGEELASGASVGSVGRDWSYAATGGPWTSTQWLAELALYHLHLWGGWAAMAGLRVASFALVLGVLALTTLRGRPAALAGIPYLVAGSAAWLFSQERPQQVSFLGAALLGGALLSGLKEASVPRWWIVLPLTVLWANLHGGWVLVPATFALISACRMMDHGLRDSAAHRALALAFAALAMGALSPAGASNVTAAARFSSAASGLIAEWDRTAPISVAGSLTVVMLILVGIGWTRPGVTVPRSEIMTVLALLIFSWSAWRNVAPSLLLLAPLVGDRLCHSFPHFGRRPEPRWSAPLGMAVAATFTVIALGSLPGKDHLPREDFPVGLATAVDTLPKPQRVLNDYNVAGLVLFFGGDEVQVGIDGRTDRYGSDYISRYAGTLEMKPGWRRELSELAPTSALLVEESGLAEYLIWSGWEEKGRESGFVLLVDPEAVAG